MNKIHILTLVGKNCITLDQGGKVYKVINPLLSAGQQVQLDFEGVEVFASPFFNQAIGKLLEGILPETLNSLFSVVNLPNSGLVTLRKVIENSKKYYSNLQHRKAIDQTIKEASENSL